MIRLKCISFVCFLSVCWLFCGTTHIAVNLKKKMGAQLSVEEKAYKKLSKELKGKDVNYSSAIDSFVGSYDTINVTPC